MPRRCGSNSPEVKTCRSYRAGRGAGFHSSHVLGLLGLVGIHAYRWNGRWNCPYTRVSAGALRHLVPGEADCCETESGSGCCQVKKMKEGWLFMGCLSKGLASLYVTFAGFPTPSSA